MAAGAPVVCSSATSLPEVVGDAGLLVDPRNREEVAAALETVLTDTALATDLRRRGRERAANFTWEAAAAATVEVYRRAMS